MGLYAALMEEVKLRLRAIGVRVPMLSSPSAPADAFLDAEFCFLQIRMICELVALGSLSAHYPLGLRKDLLKSYAADRIFTELGNINPHCFPRPVVIQRTGGGIHLGTPEGQYLSAQTLRRIYTDCGHILHRGLIKHAIRGEQKQLDIAMLDKWAEALGRLLQNHVIYVAETDMMLIVHLTVAPHNQVQVSLARSSPIQQELEGIEAQSRPTSDE